MKSSLAHKKPRPYRQGARAEAAEATGQRIADAFLSRLMAQWFDEITLDAVAADAETTVQTIVRRFGGKEGLLKAAVETMGARINAKRACPAGDVERMIDNLFQDYEETGDAVTRLLALEERHPLLKPTLDYGRNEHRTWVTGVLGASLKTLAPAARARALDALILATDVYSWKLLRRDMGRPLPAAKAIMKTLVRATLAQATHQKSSGDGQ
jgi:AcrR family transcriptional regulator